MKSSRRAVVLFVTAQFAFSACANLDNNAQQILTATVADIPSDSTELPAPTAPTEEPPTTNQVTVPSTSASTDAPITDSTSVPAKGNQSKNSFAATEVLAQLTVANEVGAGYDRDLFRHWIDDDGDDCDTRQEVLIRDSRSAPQIDLYRCKVIAGNWYSPYDGAVWEDPSDVDIDHVVALKEAWDSGAWQWSSEKRRAFANDLSDSRSLMAVTDSVNQSKGDRDPSQWMPPRRDYRCTYISLWLSVKARWSLAVDSSEAGMIRALLDDECRGLRVAKWAPTPIT